MPPSAQASACACRPAYCSEILAQLFQPPLDIRDKLGAEAARSPGAMERFRGVLRSGQRFLRDSQALPPGTDTGAQTQRALIAFDCLAVAAQALIDRGDKRVILRIAVRPGPRFLQQRERPVRIAALDVYAREQHGVCDIGGGGGPPLPRPR